MRGARKGAGGCAILRKAFGRAAGRLVAFLDGSGPKLQG
ncbi:MAG: hypothetical protein AVDCRST_MAG39-874 [uncultured Sphingomonadaceae bacterium]|uniref:Uncharacterized protein n=1 Tax=uncultured Sphingomonadaceae bacterium TaxID=169976 RepID=A0A6J4S8I2_9SPHN|nr:MAG: hypothetical protein AVDCRST_MAG39-874 [uncultured Sphingomonadaceae bacterium]